MLAPPPVANEPAGAAVTRPVILLYLASVAYPELVQWSPTPAFAASAAATRSLSVFATRALAMSAGSTPPDTTARYCSGLRPARTESTMDEATPAAARGGGGADIPAGAAAADESRGGCFRSWSPAAAASSSSPRPAFPARMAMTVSMAISACVAVALGGRWTSMAAARARSSSSPSTDARLWLWSFWFWSSPASTGPRRTASSIGSIDRHPRSSSTLQGPCHTPPSSR
mmetsp:Transcript_4114/g.18295  ORF Transcript_4114/g.18295 Transcript_4114/m.18295 type:complete len:229 (+) Transcript_4114:249-935(+)